MVDRRLLLYDGCHRQVSIVMSPVIGKQMVVIVRWLPSKGKYSNVSGYMVDRWLLLYGGC